MMEQLLHTPDRPWTGNTWSFRNEGRVYGSPAFDAIWGESMDGVPRTAPLCDLVRRLLEAPVPWDYDDDDEEEGSDISGGDGGGGRGH